jgi:hypothetical protein
MRDARVLATLAFVSTLIAPPVHGALTAKVSGGTLTVTGATPGGDVVVFGRSHRYVGGTPKLRRHVFRETDHDSDGVVAVSLESVPHYSVWVAVDYESGSYATAARGARPHVLVISPTRPWREHSIDVELGRGYLDFLLVRPRKGAWALDVFQGSVRDADGQVDGTLQLRIASMQSLFGDDSPPPHAAKKDVLAIIDPRKLDVVVVAAE